MRADRLLSLLLLLQTKGRTPARELAARLEVSERTIYRDLDALSAAGIPVYAERGPGGGCALVESYRTDLTGLTEAETAALFMGGTPGPLADLGVGPALQAAWRKLAAAMPAAQRLGAEAARQRIHLDAAGWFQSQEPVPHLKTLQEAIWNDRRIHLRYRRADGTRGERTVDPYGLVAKASVWYLVAATEVGMRVYRVTRIQEVDLLEESFARPVGFDLAEFWVEWCSRFQASLTRYVVTVRVAPFAQDLLPQVLGEGVGTLLAQAGPPDAQGWVRLELCFDGPLMARGCILNLGAGVEVLEPAELRESVRRWAEGIAGLYAAVD